jgi:hypothetical protein
MMTTCERPVYPPAVIAAVTEQLRDYDDDGNADDGSNGLPVRGQLQVILPVSMKVKPCLRQASLLRDAVLTQVEINLQALPPSVAEVDVLRASEVVKRRHFSANGNGNGGKETKEKLGSIVFVIRRPG